MGKSFVFFRIIMKTSRQEFLKKNLFALNFWGVKRNISEAQEKEMSRRICFVTISQGWN